MFWQICKVTILFFARLLVKKIKNKDQYSISISPNDFIEGKLINDTSTVRPNRIFTADKQIILRKVGRLNHMKVESVINVIVQLINQNAKPVFTGIIETIGEIKEIVKEQGNIHFHIASSFSNELKIDQSVAHDGVCLTVTKVAAGSHWVTAIQETLNRTGLQQWKEGYTVNLERSMPMGGRIDGHLVQGHVDQTGTCAAVAEQNGSWAYRFNYAPEGGNVTVKKGSICINGVSLTVVDSGEGFFSVAIIPYTYEHTNFHTLKSGDIVNLEFDIIGKYVQRILQAQQ